MALSLQSEVGTGRVSPSRGMVPVSPAHPRCDQGTRRGHPQRQRSTSLPIQSPWKPLPGPLISCVKTTNEVTPAQSLIGSTGHQLFISCWSFSHDGLRWKFVLFLARAINYFYATVKPRGKRGEGNGVGGGSVNKAWLFPGTKLLLGLCGQGQRGQQGTRRLGHKTERSRDSETRPWTLWGSELNLSFLFMPVSGRSAEWMTQSMTEYMQLCLS